MLDLLAEAFGGHVAVYAPTHEQVYGYDPTIAAQARAQVESLIRSDAERHNPLPPPVDPQLTGAARTAATRERARLLAGRTRAIAAEIRGRRSEVTFEMERQGMYEALSGPEVQQPGTARISADRVKAEVDRLYIHLSEAQRATLVRDLMRAQTVQTVRPMTHTLAVPQNLGHVMAFWGPSLTTAGFRPTRLISVNRSTAGGKALVEVEVEGRQSEPGQAPRTATMTLTSETPDDGAILTEGRGRIANPERYTWDLEETRAGGLVRRAARGQRMRGYLHHGSLDAGRHEHFRIDEGDLDFFGTNGLPPRVGVGATP